ncbi:MAG: phytanoyl-CoA dioxygenase family protein [Actinomycetota bacterium]
MVTDDLVETYAADGAVCVRNAIDPTWIELLRHGVERNLTSPSPRGRVWHAADDGRTTLYDSQAWQTIEEYRRFVLESPLAELCGRIMGSNRAIFFFDAIFVRSPGTTFRTPFHQDEPYWSVDGFDTCSAWMPLVPVAAESALEVVPGSHRWTQRFHQTNFGALTGDDRDQVVFDEADTVPFPDIEAERDRYRVRSWAMEPGDVLVFNGRTIHGGSGNLGPGQELQVFNTKWLGDDVRVVFRPEGMDPDHSEVMRADGLAPGDRPSGPHYPEVWTRPGVTV